MKDLQIFETPTPQQELIATVEEVLELAKTGKIDGVICAAIFTDVDDHVRLIGCGVDFTAGLQLAISCMRKALHDVSANE